MIKKINNCVSCEYCIGSGCPNAEREIKVCDICGEEPEYDEFYRYTDVSKHLINKEVCVECLKELSRI